MGLSTAPEWLRKEERRVYSGSLDQINVAFRIEIEIALAEGYLPGSLDWQGSGDGMTLVVTYEYDAERAPRPL